MCDVLITRSSPKPLVLTADGHYVNVSVLTEKEDKQLTIRIRSDIILAVYMMCLSYQNMYVVFEF